MASDEMRVALRYSVVVHHSMFSLGRRVMEKTTPVMKTHERKDTDEQTNGAIGYGMASDETRVAWRCLLSPCAWRHASCPIDMTRW